MNRLRAVLVFSFFVFVNFLDPSAFARNCRDVLRPAPTVEDLLDPQTPRSKWVGTEDGVRLWKPRLEVLNTLRVYREQIKTLLENLLQSEDLGLFKDMSDSMDPLSARMRLMQGDYSFGVYGPHHPFYEGLYRFSTSDSVRGQLYLLVLENIDYLTKNFRQVKQTAARKILNDTGDMLHWLGHLFEESAEVLPADSHWVTAYRLHQISLTFYELSHLKRSAAINNLNGIEHANFHIDALEKKFPDRFPVIPLSDSLGDFLLLGL